MLHIHYNYRWFCLALLFILAACSGEEETSAPFIPPQGPGIQVFSAEPSTLTQGGSTQLKWRVTGEPPPQLTLTPAPTGNGDVTGRDSVVVSPSESTTYVLSATNSEGSAERRLEVSVSAPPRLPPSEVSVTLSPGTVELAPGQTQTFTAFVTGADNQGVTWQVEGGEIDVSGATVTYTAPEATGTYTLTATSAADSAKSATATITVGEVGVSITPASETLAPGQSRTFSAEVMGANNTAVTWQASGGEVDVNGRTATYTAPDTPGDYTLTATSAADPSKSATATITVATTPEDEPDPDPDPANEAPDANFTFQADDLSVTFDASSSEDSDGSIEAYSWDFGDGETGEGESVNHTYSEVGTYGVTLTVTDDGGKSSTVEKSVQVSSADAPPLTNEAPDANFTFSATELDVDFDASASEDPDGSIASYAWDFGDGATGEGESISHIYVEAGTYDVMLTVTDDDGVSAQVEKSVEVTQTPPENQAPQPDFSASFQELAATFNASASSDPDGSVVSYTWDFGDGATGEGESVSHTYAEADTYDVMLTVTDDGGKSAQVEKSFEVNAAPTEPTDPTEPPNRAPSVLFSFAPKEGEPPLSVTFDASASEDSDGSIEAYNWDFGDGETDEGVQVEHTYEEAGIYTVTLTLEDDAGDEATASKEVEVVAPDAPEVAEASLILTEVSNSPVGSAHWVEVYNVSDGTVNLEDFELRTAARGRISPYRPAGVTTFSLPPLNLPAGGYALILGEPNEATFDGPRHVHVRGDANSGAVPAWDEDGFVELLEDGATVDFVRFGDSDEEPESAGAWGGENTPALEDESLARDEDNTDTDTASDWTLQAFATAGGPNDVPANASDNDDDGIPDSAEVSGSTFAGLDLYAMGARTSQPDIFVEVDYMNTTDPGVVPQRAALDKVAAAFEAEGFSLHFDAGTRFTSSFSPDAYNLGAGNPVVPYSEGIAFFDKGEDYANFYEIKAESMDITRRQIFHYLVFANSQRTDGGPTAVGLAEVGGNDLFVTLGKLGYGGDVAANFQAGSLMHELGHNLGLEHGGDDNTNDKPNYLSVMNYLYTLTGIGPLTGEGAGDRYLLSRLGVGSYFGLVNSPFSGVDNFVIDYSDGSSSPLNENDLNENSGLGRGAATIDLNDDGETQTSLAFDLNDDGERSTLRDHDDWGNITLPFSGTGNSEDGISTMNAGDEGEERLEPLQNDRQPLADEPALLLPQP